MSSELLRIVDAIHRDKNIDTEIIFSGIESAYLTAARRHFGEEVELSVSVDRTTGEITASAAGEHIDSLTLGRIAAQTAKQIMIQKIREAERDSLYEDFIAERGTVVVGTAQRNEGSVVTVNIGKTEAILPRSEQMPGEIYAPGERIRALILEVRKSGQRLKVVLSRAHGDFVRRLFEQEVPEIAEHIIEIRGIAREAGFRTKVAVSSIDSKVDCVGACVGVRGSRIKNITDELGGEKVEIIRYNESMQVMIPNALAPAEIEEVQIYPRMGRAIVLVREDQLSLAIGKRGQNVRLASKLVGVDIEIMTFDELTEEIDNAESNLSTIPGLSETMVDSLIEEGYFSFDDLSVIEPDDLKELTNLNEEECAEIVAFAERQSEAGAGETSSRSAILSSPSASRPAPGASSDRKRAGVPTIDELLGSVEPEVKEQKLTMDQLFGSKQSAEAAPVEEAPVENAVAEVASDEAASDEVGPVEAEGLTVEGDASEESADPANPEDSSAD
jgi:transcription termination/antitermination protein NusA